MAHTLQHRRGLNAAIPSLAAAEFWYSTDTDAWYYGTGATNKAMLAAALLAANNLSDLANAATARTNLGLGSAATVDTGTSGTKIPLLSAANTWALAQTFTAAPVFTDASGTRTALGLGNSATKNVGSAAGTVCAGDDSRLSDSRAPTGSAGGDLAGSTYPNPVIANSAVTLAKIANAAASSKLLGSGASGSGAAYSEITVGTGLTMTGTTLSTTGATTASPPAAALRGVNVLKSTSTVLTLQQIDASGYEITLEDSSSPKNSYRVDQGSNITLDFTTVGANGVATGDGSGGTITGAANNGSGLIRITSAAHGLTGGQTIKIQGVAGTTEANAVWTVTNTTTNTFDLQASTFTHAYTSGGTWYQLGWQNVYCIYDGSNIKLLGSVSASAPTLPGSYTYKGRIGACYFPLATGVMNDFKQNNYRVAVPRTVVFTAQAGATSWTQWNITTIVPPVAVAASGNFGCSGTQTYGIAVASDSSGNGEQINILDPASFASSTFEGYVMGTAWVDVPLTTAQAIFVLCFDTRSNYRLDVSGYLLR